MCGACCRRWTCRVNYLSLERWYLYSAGFFRGDRCACITCMYAEFESLTLPWRAFSLNFALRGGIGREAPPRKQVHIGLFCLCFRTL